ncbi:MAG: hypothetical protein ACUVTU_01745 [Desulfurispora sp.]|uniref:hypothetical protein n=1 Tax=Desulfurispora sp. TaxID=3014275 RepID=UPI00404B8D02
MTARKRLINSQRVFRGMVRNRLKWYEWRTEQLITHALSVVQLEVDAYFAPFNWQLPRVVATYLKRWDYRILQQFVQQMYDGDAWAAVGQQVWQKTGLLAWDVEGGSCAAPELSLPVEKPEMDHLRELSQQYHLASRLAALVHRCGEMAWSASLNRVGSGFLKELLKEQVDVNKTIFRLMCCEQRVEDRRIARAIIAVLQGYIGHGQHRLAQALQRQVIFRIYERHDQLTGRLQGRLEDSYHCQENWPMENTKKRAC